jgi:hypothetical protein
MNCGRVRNGPVFLHQNFPAYQIYYAVLYRCIIRVSGATNNLLKIHCRLCSQIMTGGQNIDSRKLHFLQAVKVMLS